MATLRLCAALLLVATSWVHAAPDCDASDPECTDIGEAYEAPRVGGRRFLLQTPRRPGAEFQNMAPHLANRRSLLAPMCSETGRTEDDVIACTNAVRSDPQAFASDMRCGGVPNSQRLGPLRKDAKLMEAARRHAQDNARMGDLTHTGSDGSSVGTRVGRTGYSYRMVRENIAWGYNSAKDVVMGWMCSSGHRKNIMSCDIHDIGVGIAPGANNRLYHAQVFACQRGESCGCGGSGREDDDIPGSGSGSGGFEGNEPGSGGFGEQPGSGSGGFDHGPGSGSGSGGHGEPGSGSGGHGEPGSGSGGHGEPGSGSGGHGEPGSGSGESPYGDRYGRYRRYRRSPFDRRSSRGDDRYSHPFYRRYSRGGESPFGVRGAEEEGQSDFGNYYDYGPEDQMFESHDGSIFAGRRGGDGESHSFASVSDYGK